MKDHILVINVQGLRWHWFFEKILKNKIMFKIHILVVNVLRTFSKVVHWRIILEYTQAKKINPCNQYPNALSINSVWTNSWKFTPMKNHILVINVPRPSLKKQLRIYSGEKTYPCSQFPKDIYESGALKKHFRLHSGEKTYFCNKWTLENALRLKTISL